MLRLSEMTIYLGLEKSSECGLTTWVDIETYLLEKSHVTYYQSHCERDYHIFYFLRLTCMRHASLLTISITIP